MELTEEQKNYIKSTRNWQTNQDLLIQAHNLTIHNSSEMIRIHKSTLEVAKEAVDYEIEFTKKNMKIFHDWCDENGIDSEIKL